MSIYRVAAVQMASGSHVAANLHEVARLIGDAVSMGANLIILPESFALMAIQPLDNINISEKPGVGMLQDFH